MTLDDDAMPSLDDKNDIISSAVEDENPTPSRGAGIEDYERQEHKEAQEKRFQQLCDASTNFPEGLTCEQFEAECVKWLANH